MNLFQRLFAKVMGSSPRHHVVAKGQTSRSGAPSIESLKAKIAAENSSSIAELKKKIAAGKENILGGIEKQFRDAQAKVDEFRQQQEASRPRESWHQFVQMGIPLILGQDFTSTNPAHPAVSWVQYDVQHKSLYIEYVKSGNTYRYWPVTEREAVSIYNSRSKGIWVWDNLRIRGTKLGHRKNYLLSGSSGMMPQWTQTISKIRSHDRAVGEESGAPGPHEVLQLGEHGASPAVIAPYASLGKFALTAPKGNAEGSKVGVSQDSITALIAKLQREQGAS